MRDALALAFGTLTTWRVPPPRRVERDVARSAMLLAPLTQVPLLVLLAVATIGWTSLGGPAPVLAVLLVGALVLSTRGMHVDGLADTADGLSASYDRERALAVMKSSDVGPSGVAAVVLALGLQAAALTHLIGSGAGLALAAVALLVSRQVLAGACHRRVPAASRTSGLGVTVAGTVPSGAALASGVVLLGVALAPAAWGAPWWAGSLVVLAGWGAAAGVVVHACRRLGGITGDVLGATIEVALAAALATATLLV